MLTVLVAVALGSSAWSADGPTIAVVGVHEGYLLPDEQVQGSRALVRRIERGSPLNGLEPQEVAEAIRGRESIILQDAYLTSGRRMLEEGRNLYAQAQPGEAVVALQGAIASIKQGMMLAEASTELWEAYMYLGTAHLSSDNEDGARSAFRQAVAVNPERLPSAAMFAPSVVSLYREVLAEQVALVSVLKVTSDQPKVTIYLNDVKRGETPLTLKDVPPGEVKLVARGEQAYVAQFVEVPASSKVPVELKMGPAKLGTASSASMAKSREVGALYRALGEHASVDLVLLAGVDGETLLLQLYSVRSGLFSKPVEMSAAGDTITRLSSRIAELLKQVTPAGGLDPDATSPTAISVDIGANDLLAGLLLSPGSE